MYSQHQMNGSKYQSYLKLVDHVGYTSPKIVAHLQMNGIHSAWLHCNKSQKINLFHFFSSFLSYLYTPVLFIKLQNGYSKRVPIILCIEQKFWMLSKSRAWLANDAWKHSIASSFPLSPAVCLCLVCATRHNGIEHNAAQFYLINKYV